jgi:hypothetical protein
MADSPSGSKLCPYRYIVRGRTFCALAIRESRYTVDEVIPPTCAGCTIAQVLEVHPCGRMALGLEVGVFGGRQTVEMYYFSCEVTVERLLELEGCGEGLCPYWEPLDPARVGEIVAEARQRQNQHQD